jgi:tight adherence protein B
MQLALIGFGLFVLSIAVIELVAYGYRNLRSTQRAKIRKRLRKHVYVESGRDGSEILKKRVLSDVPFLNNLLLHTPGIQRLDRLIIQANAGYPMGVYVLMCLLLGFVGFALGVQVNRGTLVSFAVALLSACLPILQLKRLKKKRLAQFKKQLPDGLDLIARALKAGHAFTGGMGLAAEEFEDPLGPEFSEALDEINFGVSVPDALKNLLGRIDCEELKYFVVGVILQRETGGNLAELMETLATLIRERFKFAGKVRTLTAEGRISAVILVGLPFAVAGFIWLTNPEFLDPLVNEPAGRIMLGAAVVMMTIGIIVINKMVKVEV